MLEMTKRVYRKKTKSIGVKLEKKFNIETR